MMNSNKLSSPPPPMPIEQLEALKSMHKQSNAVATDVQELPPMPQSLEELVTTTQTTATPPIPMPLAQMSAGSVTPPVPMFPE